MQGNGRKSVYCGNLWAIYTANYRMCQEVFMIRITKVVNFSKTSYGCHKILHTNYPIM